MGWQPIETAPKDGSGFIGWWPESKNMPYGFTWWLTGWPWADQWYRTDHRQYAVGQPTHWMPLPEPPKP